MLKLELTKEEVTVILEVMRCHNNDRGPYSAASYEDRPFLRVLEKLEKAIT